MLSDEVRDLSAQVVEAAVQHLELSAAAPSGPASPTHRGRAGPSRLSQVRMLFSQIRVQTVGTSCESIALRALHCH